MTTPVDPGGPGSGPRGRAWLIGLVAGGLLLAYGAVGLFGDADSTDPADLARWSLGALLAHDLLLAPAACLVGVLLVRRVPRWARPPLRAGLLAAAVAVVLALPGLMGTAADSKPDNPTVQPNDERTALAWTLAAIAVAVAGWTAGAASRERRRAAARAR